MQRSLQALVRKSPITRTTTTNHLKSVKQNLPFLPSTRPIFSSPTTLMPRYSGSAGSNDKIRFSCPNCKTPIMFYCRFSGTRRHIRCHKCDYLITVAHTTIEPAAKDTQLPESLYNSDMLEELSRSDLRSSMDDKRLDRLFAPPYEEPLSGEDERKRGRTHHAPPPREIFQYLDKFVQGQDRAKRVLAVSIYNHYKRLRSLEGEGKEGAPRLDKSNVLLIGPTGSGKTYLYQMAAKLLDVPMVVCDCTSLTQAGYVGEDVESVVVRLWQAASQDLERTQRGIIVLDELDKLASKRNKHGGKDIGGEGVQQSLLKIIEGTTVTVSDKSKNKSYQIDTRNIMFLASGAFIGLDNIIKKRTSAKSLGFGAPISTEQQQTVASNQGNEEEDSEKVSEARKERRKMIKQTEDQNRARDKLLVQVEPRDILDYGVIPELAGRIPVVVTLDSLTQEDLMVIATNKERGVISQLKDLLSLNNCDLQFTDDAIRSVAELAFCKKTGARALKSIVETTLLDAMFEVPGSDITQVVINSDTVLEGVSPDYTRQGDAAAKA